MDGDQRIDAEFREMHGLGRRGREIPHQGNRCLQEGKACLANARQPRQAGAEAIMPGGGILLDETMASQDQAARRRLVEARPAPLGSPELGLATLNSSRSEIASPTMPNASSQMPFPAII